MVEHGDPVAFGTGKGDIGVVDRIADVAVLKKLLDLLRSHNRAVLIGFRGSGSQVRRADNIGASQLTAGGEIGGIGLYLTVFQGFNQRIIIHNGATGIID